MEFIAHVQPGELVPRWLLAELAARRIPMPRVKQFVLMAPVRNMDMRMVVTAKVTLTSGKVVAFEHPYP